MLGCSPCASAAQHGTSFQFHFRFSRGRSVCCLLSLQMRPQLFAPETPVRGRVHRNQLCDPGRSRSTVVKREAGHGLVGLITSHIVGPEGVPLSLATGRPGVAEEQNLRPMPSPWGPPSPLGCRDGSSMEKLNWGLGSWREFGRLQVPGCVSLATFPRASVLPPVNIRPGPGESPCPLPALQPSGDLVVVSTPVPP